VARYDRKDPLYERAKREGYRSRGVYKLRELLERAGGLKPGATVVELGCWPGGWLQELAARVGPRGAVIGVDTREVEPLGEPVTVLRLDITDPGSPAALQRALGRRAQAVLCDAAPSLTGIRDADRAAEGEIYEAALAVAFAVLRRGGFLIVKGFPGPEAQEFVREIRRHFGQVAHVKAEGSRKTSKEHYWVARTFKGAPEGTESTDTPTPD
jgi:23S rRNA (uridine2552-2'-O)-methyltransferase